MSIGIIGKFLIKYLEAFKLKEWNFNQCSSASYPQNKANGHVNVLLKWHPESNTVLLLSLKDDPSSVLVRQRVTAERAKFTASPPLARSSLRSFVGVFSN